MKYTLLLLSLVILIFSVNAQKTYDKDFYLIHIDSGFVFDKQDKHDVDSVLKLYHATNNDTLKLYYLRLFSEGMSNEYLWTRYNKLMYEVSKGRKDSLDEF